MGGDGGTKAINRAYLRGAGAASTTGDRPSSSSHAKNGGNHQDKHLLAEESNRAMHYCYISDQPLQFFDESNNSNSDATIAGASSQLLSTSNIVTCRYGRLYNKEAAIEALLQRKQLMKASKVAVAEISNSETSINRLGLHVRGMKDLYPVRFQTIRQHDADKTNNNRVSGITTTVSLVCPITGRELNGQNVAYVLLPGHADNTTTVNVVSEYALKTLTEHDIMIEYGATKKIRLLAPSSMYEAIDIAYQKEIIEAASKNKRRKLKHDKS